MNPQKVAWAVHFCLVCDDMAEAEFGRPRFRWEGGAAICWECHRAKDALGGLVTVERVRRFLGVAA